MLTPQELADIEESRVGDADCLELVAEVKRLRAALKDAADQVAEADHAVGAATSREVGAQAEVKRLRDRLGHLAELARTADHETSEAYILHDSITDLIAACKDGGEGR